MKILKSRIVALVLLVFVLGVTCTNLVVFSQETKVQEITAHLQQKYDSMQDATAKFSQRVKFAFSNMEQKFTGSLVMKKPNHYRVESEHQTLVTDGFSVWAYSPVNKQVLIDRYKENQNSLSPEKFLLNLPAQYYSTLLENEKLAERDAYVLKLVPKDDQSFVKSVKMWVEPGSWTVRKVLIIDINDTETEYTISEVKFNTKVPDSLFVFTPPAGVEVVDLRK